MKTKHKFDSTGEAYDACQCDESIKTGDMLVVKDTHYRGACTGRDEDGFRVYQHSTPVTAEIVGLAWAWPIAVTVEDGDFHGITDDPDSYDRVIGDAGFTAEQIEAAVEFARSKKLNVRGGFIDWLTKQKEKA